MTAIVRIYPSEEAAQAAAAKLTEAGYSGHETLLASDLAGREEDAVRSAADAGVLPGGHRATCLRALKQGQSLVAMNPRFGHEIRVTAMLEDAGAVDSEALPYIATDDPDPFSRFLGLPTLARFEPMTGLISSSWTAFGSGTKSDRAAPLSSMLGMGTSAKPSSKKSSSMGLPLTSRSAAPLSSMFGMKTVVGGKASKETSFGFPMLSRNPAPLSSLFGMATLSKDR